MGKQQPVILKQFNPYDLNDVAEINDSGRQHPIRQRARKENGHNRDGEIQHRGLLKLQDEEKSNSIFTTS